MSGEGIYVGRLLGIPIRLHYSWFIIFILVAWALSTNYFPIIYPDWAFSTSVLTGICTSLLFFASLLVHELMHSLMAVRHHIPVKSITFFAFGGVSQITQEPGSASVELKLALAGPLASILLGLIFLGGWLLTPVQIETLNAALFWLGWINLTLAAFNLLPGFPMDGGRVLRSIIWWRTKDMLRATKISCNVGKAVGSCLIGGGIWYIFRSDWFNGLWLALIGWFVIDAARQSYHQTVIMQKLKGHSARDIVHNDCQEIPSDFTIDNLVNQYMQSAGKRCFWVVDGNKIQGMVTFQDIKNVLRAEWPVVQIKQIMKPIDKLKSVHPQEDLASVMQLMTEENIDRIPVIDNGNIIGLITRSDLHNFIDTDTR
jgi:Zn-dependent protease